MEVGKPFVPLDGNEGLLTPKECEINKHRTNRRMPFQLSGSMQAHGARSV